MLRYSKNQAKVFFCPANDLPAKDDGSIPRPYSPDDFVAAPGAKTPDLWGRFGYWWVADPICKPETAAPLEARGYRPAYDWNAAGNYFHTTNKDGFAIAVTVFDTSYPCRPGFDY